MTLHPNSLAWAVRQATPSWLLAWEANPRKALAVSYDLLRASAVDVRAKLAAKT